MKIILFIILTVLFAGLLLFDFDDKIKHFALSMACAVLVCKMVKDKKIAKKIIFLFLVSFSMKEFLFDKRPEFLDIVANALGCSVGLFLGFNE